MPKIVQGSISILSDAGLGMAMFSLGESYTRVSYPGVWLPMHTHTPILSIYTLFQIFFLLYHISLSQHRIKNGNIYNKKKCTGVFLKIIRYGWLLRI